MERQKRSLLPIIQQYSGFLSQFHQRQSQLKQQEYSLAKKEQGEKFISNYSTLLNKVTDSNSLAKTMNEALTYAGANELTQFMPVLETIARNQNSVIKDTEDKQRMNAIFDSTVKTFGTSPLMWEGKTTDIKSVADLIKNSGNTPETNIQMMELALKNIGKSTTDVIIEKGNKYKIAKSIQDPLGNVLGETKYGDFSFDKNSGKYYADYSKDKKFSNGEELPSDVVSKVSAEQQRYREIQQQRANQNKPQRVQATYKGDPKTAQAVLLKEDGLLYDINTGKVLQDQSGWMYQTSTSYATQYSKDTAEGRKDIVRTLQDSLRGIETQIAKLDENTYAEVASLIKYKGDDNDYQAIVTKYNTLLNKENRNEAEELMFRTMQSTLQNTGIELTDQDINKPLGQKKVQINSNFGLTDK